MRRGPLALQAVLGGRRAAKIRPVTVVTLYGKPGCHLCEEAREVVMGVRDERDFHLEEVDVSLDPELHREYGERIPVVAVNGEEAFQYHVDGHVLRRMLDGDPPPSR